MIHHHQQQPSPLHFPSPCVCARACVCDTSCAMIHGLQIRFPLLVGFVFSRKINEKSLGYSWINKDGNSQLKLAKIIPVLL